MTDSTQEAITFPPQDEVDILRARAVEEVFSSRKLNGVKFSYKYEIVRRHHDIAIGNEDPIADSPEHDDEVSFDQPEVKNSQASFNLHKIQRQAATEISEICAEIN